MMEPVVPINAPGRLTPDERLELVEVMTRVVDSGWWVLGPEVDGFERELATATGAAGAVGVANGTDALELALRGVGVTAGDRVAVAANAGGYATTAVLAIGAIPWFVDVGADLQADPTRMAAACDAGCRAAVVTHLYGAAAPVEAVVAAARAADAAVVEDCAQAHGLRMNGRHAGTIGDAGAFSFYPTKNLGAIGDAGAVVSRHDDVIDRVRRLRQYGWHRRYEAAEPGRNSRMDELQAAILRWGLPRLADRNQRRATIARHYRDAAPGLRWVAAAADHTVHHLCVLRSGDRERTAAALRASGVETAVHYPVPDHRQGWFRAEAPLGDPLPETELAADEVLTVPCFPELTDAEVEVVAAALATLDGAR